MFGGPSRWRLQNLMCLLDEHGYLRSAIIELLNAMAISPYLKRQALLDAGINDFLLSFHTVDGELFRKITGGDLDKMKQTMQILDDKDFSYCTNTVVTEYTYESLPHMAEYLLHHNIRIVNFIMMRMDWGLRNQPGFAVKIKGNWSEIAKYVTDATDILDSNGIAVNIRYAPYCVFKGREKYIVGYKGIQFDAYEWRNGTLRASEGTPWLKNKDEKDYYENRVPVFESDPVFNLTFHQKCSGCALRAICDGVDKNHTGLYGWDEFKPYEGENITDIVHFRYDYPGPFLMKEEQYEPFIRGHYNKKPT